MMKREHKSISDRITYAVVILLTVSAYALNYFTIYHMTMMREMKYINDMMYEVFDPFAVMKWVTIAVTVLLVLVIIVCVRNKNRIGKFDTVTYAVITALYYNIAIGFAALEFDAVFIMMYLLGAADMIEAVRMLVKCRKTGM